MIPQELSRDLEQLRALGYAVEGVTELPGETLVVFSAFKLPDGKYNMETCRLLVRVPQGYPNAAIDMFYTQPNLLLASGAPARQSDVLEELGGAVWRRFSWHRNVAWKPGVDTLTSYASFIEDNFARGQ